MESKDENNQNEGFQDIIDGKYQSLALTFTYI